MTMLNIAGSSVRRTAAVANVAAGIIVCLACLEIGTLLTLDPGSSGVNVAEVATHEGLRWTYLLGSVLFATGTCAWLFEWVYGMRSRPVRMAIRAVAVLATVGVLFFAAAAAYIPTQERFLRDGLWEEVPAVARWSGFLAGVPALLIGAWLRRRRVTGR
jgi:hypothetical protein